jgi:hypothetical protein
MREKYCCLVVGGWFVLKEKYCSLVVDKWRAAVYEATLLCM